MVLDPDWITILILMVLHMSTGSDYYKDSHLSILITGKDERTGLDYSRKKEETTEVNFLQFELEYSSYMHKVSDFELRLW